MYGPFANELTRRLQLLFNNPPAVTTVEVAVVSATAAFLMLVPPLFALGDARRRRAALRPPPVEPTPAWLPPEPQAAEATDSSGLSDASTDIPPSTDASLILGEVSGVAADAANEVVAEPAGPLNLTELPVTSEPPAPAELSPVSVPEPPPAPVVLPAEPVHTPVMEARESVPPVAHAALPPIERLPEVISAGAPLAAVAGPFTPRPTSVAAPHEFALFDLRQARLTDWPPRDLHTDAEQSRLWQEGERLAARYDARISKLPLHAPWEPESTALARVDCDGSSYRLHFFLFADLWPSSLADAVGRAVFEIDPATDAVEGWVEA